MFFVRRDKQKKQKKKYNKCFLNTIFYRARWSENFFHKEWPRKKNKTDKNMQNNVEQVDEFIG